MRPFQKPLAGMVICGSGLYLWDELTGSEKLSGFPDPDLFDHFAHSGRRLLASPLPASALRSLLIRLRLLLPEPGNPAALSAWPRLSGPSC
jgi:hypothetical protein